MKEYTIMITLDKREKDSDIIRNNSYELINFIIQLDEENHEKALMKAITKAKEEMNKLKSTAHILKIEIIDMDMI